MDQRAAWSGHVGRATRSLRPACRSPERPPAGNDSATAGHSSHFRSWAPLPRHPITASTWIHTGTPAEYINTALSDSRVNKTHCIKHITSVRLHICTLDRKKKKEREQHNLSTTWTRDNRRHYEKAPTGTQTVSGKRKHWPLFESKDLYPENVPEGNRERLHCIFMTGSRRVLKNPDKRRLKHDQSS